jgi:hypothetical protein
MYRQAHNSSGGLRSAHKRPVSKVADGRSFDRLIANLCGAFVRATVDEIDLEINRWLRRIVLALGLDRSALAESNDAGSGSFSHGWARDPSQIIRPPLDVNALLPWVFKKIRGGETVIMATVNGLPEEGAVDRESYRKHGTKSNITIPIRSGSEVVVGIGSRPCIASENGRVR